jgi:hypothetical protein
LVIATLTKPAIPNRLFLPNIPLGFIAKQDFFSKLINEVGFPGSAFRLVTGFMSTSSNYYKPSPSASKDVTPVKSTLGNQPLSESAVLLCCLGHSSKNQSH